MATERITVKPGPGFDPNNAAHLAAVLKNIADKTDHGTGWSMQSHDPDEGSITLTRQSAVTQVAKSSKVKDSYDVGLRAGTKPADGDQVAAQLESDPRHKGFIMTAFEPFLGQATLSKMDVDTQRARGALAVALGVKPWDVQVKPRSDGGFTVGLPRTYVPSKHDAKLTEVAETVVGREGWFVSTNAQALTAEIIPSEPPTFPGLVAYPMKELRNPNLMKTPFGMMLPEPGEELGPNAIIDWGSSAFVMVAGMPGSGKDLALTERVPVPVSERFPTGWATVGELELGQMLYMRDGSLAPVDYLAPIVEREMLELTFSDGQKVTCDVEHLWSVSSRQSRMQETTLRGPREERAAEVERLKGLSHGYRNGEVATAAQLAELCGIAVTSVHKFANSLNLPNEARIVHGRNVKVWPADEFLFAYAEYVQSRRAPMGLRQLLTAGQIRDGIRLAAESRTNYAVPVAEAVQGPDVELALDPYVLGAWLGDGARWHPDRIASEDPTIIDSVVAAGFPVRRMENNGSAATTYIFDGLRNALGAAGFTSRPHDDEPATKLIPAVYLRASYEQRLALLQGLMDTDGTVSPGGRSELCFTDERLTTDALELIRSLGIRVSMTSGEARISDVVPGGDGSKRSRFTGTRYRLNFTTSVPVFRLERKLTRLPESDTCRTDWNYIVDVQPAGRALGRCIRVDHPEHLFLCAGFIPTHNTVTLNAIIAQQIAAGALLCIADVPDKKQDFTWMKHWCMDGGWGADSDVQTLAMLSLVLEESKRRSKIIESHGVTNWTELPPEAALKPILIIVDELSAMLVIDRIPTGVPKDNPIVIKKTMTNLIKVSIDDIITTLVAVGRAAGIRAILSTQVTNASTGLGPSTKSKVGHKLLLGSNPSKTGRSQAFSDESGVPQVPANVRADAKVAKGVGAAELDGQAPFIYKSFYAPIEAYKAELERIGARVSSRPEPTAREIARFNPIEDMDVDGEPPSRMREEVGGFGRKPQPRQEREDGLSGAAAAAHDLRVAAVQAAQATR